MRINDDSSDRNQNEQDEGSIDEEELVESEDRKWQLDEMKVLKILIGTLLELHKLNQHRIM